MTHEKQFALWQKKCKRCEHLWTPRKATLPKWCPRCHSRYWSQNEAPPKGRRPKKLNQE